MTLEEMEARRKALRAELVELECAIIRKQHEAAPVKAGQIVLNKKGERGRVCKVELLSFGTWVEVNPQRKDGTFGTAIRRWFEDWRLEQQPA